MVGKKADDIFKDGVVIERVIIEVGSEISYHVLTKINYSN
jgi:hypothetical protein